MGSKKSAYRSLFAAVVLATLAAPCPARAAVGEFSVANCIADQFNSSTRAFAEFATRGMSVRRACNTEGQGDRGLYVRNVVRKGRVPPGSLALLTIDAPPGTRFTTFRWAYNIWRSDCRYALQAWADAPDLAIPIITARPNVGCPRPGRVQMRGYDSDYFVVTNATRIVIRVICVGSKRRKFCSARGTNQIVTYEAEVGIADFLLPTAAIVGDTPLAQGAWVGGTQPLNYSADDNVGVRTARAMLADRESGKEQRPCALATPRGAFATQVPCPNGPGHIDVDTDGFGEGTQALVVRAEDAAGNVADSPPVTVRIDNSPPNRVDVGVEGGDAWRNTSDFGVGWTNPPEPDRAPIAAATYKLCPVGGGSCSTGQQSEADISRLAVRVPAPGEWNLSLWRRDAAGNQTEAAESVPVRLRYDPEPPQLAFEPPSASDPTLVAVAVKDAVSGLAGGAIEIGTAGSGTWQTLPTQKDGHRLLARIDDIALSPGAYQLRAHAFDQANNEASTDRRLDGQPMSVTLPLRIASSMQAGFERVRTVRQTIRRHGKRRVVRRRETVLEPSARVRSGGDARVAGRLVNRDGDGIAGAAIHIFSTSSVSPEQLIAVVQTDAEGRFRYTAAGSASRTLRLAYAGSPLILPAQRAITMSVPALTSLHVSRKRVLNGDSVTFRGKLRTEPVPATGKLLELQVRLSDRWQTFRTARTDAAGRWAIRYRFKRTRGEQRFRFRARLPQEGGYPFAAGGSKPITVRVRGL